MARPKKPEERNRIRDVAFNVFSVKGVEEASFSDIAKEASVSKSLVQYYFPKKEQFIADFIDKSLSAVEQIVKEDLDYSFEHELGQLYAIGCCQFHFAMYNDKMNSLRRDILRDRGNTEMVLRNAIDWIIRNTDAFPVDDPVALDDCKKAMVFVVGGTADYLYDCILYDVEFDLKFLSDTITTVLNPYLEAPFNEGDRIMGAISPEWLEKARKKYNRMVFAVK